MHAMRRSVRSLTGIYLPLVPYIVFALFPLYFMLITSFKSDSELYDISATPFMIREGTTLDHYRLLFQDTAFLTWLGNTLFVSILATLASVTVGTFAAFAARGVPRHLPLIPPTLVRALSHLGRLPETAELAPALERAWSGQFC